jgi:hypothetical protein
MKDQDMFEENENHPMKIEPVPVLYPPDEEVDASKIDFSSPEVLRQAVKDFKEWGIIFE